jgi:PKD repeat protein
MFSFPGTKHSLSKKIHAIILLLCTISFSGFSQQGCIPWVSYSGGLMEDMSRNMVCDNAGNTYICGMFSGVAAFQGITLTSLGGNDAFIAKYNNSGQLQWITHGGGPQDDRSFNIDLDSAGNIFVTGDFEGQFTFGQFTLQSNGDKDMFVCKLNNSGTISWLKQGGGPGKDIGRAIAVNRTNEIVVLGYFSDYSSFGNLTLGSNGLNDIFIAKYNQNGDIIWVSKAGGDGGDDPRGLFIDNDNSIWTSGYFSSTLIMQGTSQTLTSMGPRDAYVAKTDENGNYQMAFRAGGNGNETAEKVILDDQNNIYISGYFTETSFFGSITLAAAGGLDSFIAKYDPLGNVIWAKKGGGTGDDFSIDLTKGPNNNFYITGYFEGSSNFSEYTVQSAGMKDIFVVEYSPSGVVKSVESYGGLNDDIGYSIKSNLKEVLVTGVFGSQMNVGSLQIPFSGWSDILLFPLSEGLPQANFSYCMGADSLTVNFSNQSSDTSSVLWNFGDGHLSNLVNPTHTYSKTGSYEVKLTVHNSCGSDSLVKSVTLCNPAQSFYEYSTNLLTATFNNTSLDSDSSFWSFGDGHYSTQTNPEHSYATGGLYEVKLISYNQCSSDTLIKLITVCSILTSDFEFIANNELTTFNNLSIGYSSVLWTFGDGTTSTLLNPEHEYPGNGDYTVRLYCYSPCDTLVSVDTVTVCLLPVPAFTYSFSGDMTYQFINQSTDYLTCMWYFGDGDSSSLPNPVHTYNSSTVFPVQLVLYNNCGSAVKTDSINLNTDLFNITNDPVIVHTISNGNLLINIKEPDGIQDLFLYDLKGCLRYKTQIQTSVYINTNSYNSGSYILRIINNNKELFKRKICITH